MQTSRSTHTFFRRAAWILGDQLSLQNAALLALNKHQDVVVMIESLEHATAMNHHKAKLLLCFSAMRHFRDELRALGYTVFYYELPCRYNFLSGLQALVSEHGICELLVMEPHEIATVRFAETLPALLGIPVRLMPNTMFLTSRTEFIAEYQGESHLVMENYYRKMRRKLRVLMENGKPIGGQWNFNKANRHTARDFYAARLCVPPLWQPSFDTIDREVQDMVETFFPNHIGSLSHFALPTTRKDAERFLDDFITHRLRYFGEFEDTMIQSEPVLFHSVLSPLLNIGLLSPMQCVEKAVTAFEAGFAPLNSVEGFVRQIIGWREFIYGCYWLKMSKTDYHEENYFHHTRPLPQFYWTGDTPLNCLSQVIKKVLKYGYTHHIERLMILGNFALLAGVCPKQLNQWFWELYVNAYDWVVTPNVMGMSQFADGGFVATKPYCSSGAYIEKMSDYCKSCIYRVKDKVGPNACPFNYLYWDFLMRHEAKLRPNPRIGMIYGTLDRKSAAEKAAIRESAEAFLASLPGNSYYT
ncbi:MAG: cryptochrome/photolyase family protein [Chloroherpetonaceae bacterium]|nr:cryptochrome/photolyase family protein [Chloroherpetonaceae bacterium]